MWFREFVYLCVVDVEILNIFFYILIFSCDLLRFLMKLFRYLLIKFVIRDLKIIFYICVNVVVVLESCVGL